MPMNPKRKCCCGGCDINSQWIGISGAHPDCSINNQLSPSYALDSTFENATFRQWVWEATGTGGGLIMREYLATSTYTDSNCAPTPVVAGDWILELSLPNLGFLSIARFIKKLPGGAGLTCVGNRKCGNIDMGAPCATLFAASDCRDTSTPVIELCKYHPTNAVEIVLEDCITSGQSTVYGLEADIGGIPNAGDFYETTAGVCQEVISAASVPVAASTPLTFAPVSGPWPSCTCS